MATFVSLSLLHCTSFDQDGLFLFLNGLLQERKTSQRNVPPHIAPSLCKNFNVAMVSSSPSALNSHLLLSSPRFSSLLLSPPPLSFFLSSHFPSAPLVSALLSSPLPQKVILPSKPRVCLTLVYTPTLQDSLIAVSFVFWTTAGFSLSLVTCGPQDCHASHAS